MLFNSFGFLVFFPVVVIIYYVIPLKLRTVWLLGASYFFYMTWNVKYVVLLAFSTVLTWIGGQLIYRYKNYRKLIAVICAIGNLAILFWFKYFSFFVELLNGLLSRMQVAQVNIMVKLVLPVGISFYIFQALGYLIDVYRGEIEPEANFVRYALFVSFFPQLVAGPIERSRNLLHQLKRIEVVRLFDYQQISSGLIYMICGYFVKLVIADRAAICVNTIFEHYYELGTIELIFGAFLFGIQIYCDFSGYSMIAIGAARTMGIELMENFDAPYLSSSIQEFWRKWHISLSSWFRDYLYIPLGGNRKGELRKCMNLMVTFLVSGLWHGAKLTFIVWGGVHGIYLIAEEVGSKVLRKLRRDSYACEETKKINLGKCFIVFVLVNFAWIFFRADTVDVAINYIARMCSHWNPWVLFDGTLVKLGLDGIELNILFLSVFVLLITDVCKRRDGVKVNEIIKAQESCTRAVLIVILVVVILIFGEYGAGYDAQQFIYFQF